MMMSFPDVNHLQYRLTPEGPKTRLQLTHRAMGLFDGKHQEGVNKEFAFWL